MVKCAVQGCKEQGLFELFKAHETGSNYYCLVHKNRQLKYNKNHWKSENSYMSLPCARCRKYKAVSLDNYNTKRGIFIVKYWCENCKHKGKRSSHIRKNAKFLITSFLTIKRK